LIGVASQYASALGPTADEIARQLTGYVSHLASVRQTNVGEEGIVVPRGRGKLERELAILLDESQVGGLSPRVVKLICDMRAQWGELDRA
jgi:transposase